MKNLPIINQLVNMLLLFHVSSFAVFCKEVQIVRIRISQENKNWDLDSNFEGQVYFGASNGGGYQKWIIVREGFVDGCFQLINLVTQQVLAVKNTNNNQFIAYTETNTKSEHQIWRK